MNNTHALLLAFIEASGYEVEEVGTVIKGHHMQGMGMDNKPTTWTTPDTIETAYKVTKKGEGKGVCPLCNGRKGHHKFKTFVECSYCDGSGEVENL